MAFGEEIPALLNCYKSDSVPTCAITADIVSLALARCYTPPVTVNYEFSQDRSYSQFLTTGIVTTDNVCKQHPAVLRKLLEGIQKSILVLRSSKPIAFRVCEQLAARDEFYRPGQPKLNKDQVGWIIDTINREQFYPASLMVSRQQWQSALVARAKVEMWEQSELSAAVRMYDRCVVQRLADEARHFIVREFEPEEAQTISKQLGGWIQRVMTHIFGDPLYQWAVLVLLIAGLLVPSAVSAGYWSLKMLLLSAAGLVFGASVTKRLFAKHLAGLNPVLRVSGAAAMGLGILFLLWYGYQCEVAHKPSGIYFALGAILASFVYEIIKTPWHRLSSN